jgi:hypothetical protein
MSQTLLALLALGMATLLGFNQQRATIQTYEVRIRDEYAVAASGLLMHVMEMAAARSFDQTSTPDHIHSTERLPTLGEFSLPDTFGHGEAGCDLMEPWNTPSCDDVDDLHSAAWQSVDLVLPSGRMMAFEVLITVEYVSDADVTVPVVTRTHNKRVTLGARAAHLPRLGTIVRLERVIAYDPVKAAADYEVSYGPVVAL